VCRLSKRESVATNRRVAPPTMDRTLRGPGAVGPQEEELQRLANNLNKETSAEATITCLEALNAALEDELTVAKRAKVLLSAGTLPTVVRLLKGDMGPHASADPHNMLSTTRGLAGKLLSRLLDTDFGMAAVASAPDIIPPLIDALRDAPTDQGRCAAAYGLLILAHMEPASQKAVAEGGVMGPLLALYIKLGADSLATPSVKHVLELAHVLVRSGTGPLREIRRAIRVADEMQAFAAMLILKVNIPAPIRTAWTSRSMCSAVIPSLQPSHLYTVA
jgi:hypothetical protein